MSKKKRVATAPVSGSAAAQHASTTTSNSAAAENADNAHSGDSAQSALDASSPSATTGHSGKDSQDQLEGVLPYYTSLAADIAGASLALDCTLWIHNVVALMIQNVLMYDQHVGKEQLLLLLWTALWLGRAFIVTSQVSPFASLRAEKTRREVVLWRLMIGGLGLALHAPFLYVHDSPVRSRHLQLLVQILLMEIVSIGMFDQSKARLTWSQIMIATTEALFATSIFSVMYNHRDNLIYDRIAFAVTGLSVTTHTFVLLAAKLVAFSPSSAREAAAKWNQKRGRELVAELRHAIDLHDGDESDAEALKQKKKKAARSQAQPHDAEAASQVAAATTTHSTAKPLSVMRNLLQHASVKVAMLMVGQALLLLLQAAAATHLMLSWEITSILMLSSTHVLWTVLQLHEKLSRAMPASARS
ncbi:hypothetical protein Gpo141_00004914, partial [Globisporangium polare]